MGGGPGVVGACGFAAGARSQEQVEDSWAESLREGLFGMTIRITNTTA